jgi:aconitate hydratase
LYNHLWDGIRQKLLQERTDYVDFAPDEELACQDATAQMALLQFIHAGTKLK